MTGHTWVYVPRMRSIAEVLKYGHWQMRSGRKIREDRHLDDVTWLGTS